MFGPMDSGAHPIRSINTVPAFPKDHFERIVMTQQRKYSRLPFSTESSLTLGAEGEDGEEMETRLIDISFKGALVEAPNEIKPKTGTPALLRIQLDHSEVVIEMKAEVAHQGPEGLGLHCLSIDMDSMIHLRRLMELNLGDAGLLERELGQLG